MNVTLEDVERLLRETGGYIEVRPDLRLQLVIGKYVYVDDDLSRLYSSVVATALANGFRDAWPVSTEASGDA